MQAIAQTVPISKARFTAGHILSGFAVLFFVVDAVMKFFKPAPVVEAFAQLGWPIGVSVGIGSILLICTALYVVPRTAILGAILLTGYLGGAVAANVRVDNPLFSHTLFPVYMGILLWAALFLRDNRVRVLVS